MGGVMELLGIGKFKEMLFADDDGIRTLGAEEIEAMPESEETREMKQMLRCDFVIGAQALEAYYQPREEEKAIIEAEGWEITEKGVLMESFPAKIEDGVLMLDYERTGENYLPVRQDEEGCLHIYDGMLKIEKA